MKKQIKQKIVFESSRCVNKWKDNSYTWGEVKKEFALKNFELLDTDQLLIYYDEGFDEPDNSLDPYHEIRVGRDVEETDEEFQKRKEGYERYKIEQEKKDYKTYLKLKEQFENPQP